jgi:hypothetical protein
MTAVDPGSADRRRSSQEGPDPGVITIEGETITATSPEGAQATMSVARFAEVMGAGRMDTGGVILPDGVKAVLSSGALTVWVHQTPPRVHQLRWIAEGSGAPFGPGAEYRDVRISLPYVIVLAVFCSGPGGRPTLTGGNECFFLNKPLESLADELLFPALLNCSRFVPAEGHPLSWICTQYLKPPAAARQADKGKVMRAGLRALLSCLLETGFNYSSEHHEGSSWFTESRKCDPRIETVDRWQEATARDPLFAIEVPWLKTGLSLEQIVQRIFQYNRCLSPPVTAAGDIARILFNQNGRRRRLLPPGLEGLFA